MGEPEGACVAAVGIPVVTVGRDEGVMVGANVVGRGVGGEVG